MKRTIFSAQKRAAITSLAPDETGNTSHSRGQGMRMNTIVTATLFAAATIAQAEIVGTTATVRPNNSLVVDIQVATAGDAAQVVVTYQTPGTEPLVSRPVPVSLTGLTTVTIGRLRASRTYNYRVWAINRNGELAGTPSQRARFRQL